MKVNLMSENSIVTLFETLMEDGIDKSIVRLIGQDLNEEEIIKLLLEINKDRS